MTEPEYTLIDTLDSLQSILPRLYGLPISPPSLYVDLEGVNLSRDGTLSIIQIYVHPSRHTYLIDIHVLGAAGFTTESGSGSLKALLESPTIPKCFFDVRGDSDALYHLFGISVQFIHDLQLMELATRSRPQKKYVNGLANCIKWDAGLSREDVDTFLARKEEGRKLFAPDLGGKREVFNDRPMREELVRYCVQDVECLPRLWAQYDRKMVPATRERVRVATVARIELSKSAAFSAGSSNNRLSPW